MVKTTGSAKEDESRRPSVKSRGVKVTFSVGAERIVRKENGVTRQKI